MSGRLPRSFFCGYTPSVARRLVGKTLVRVDGENVLSGKIVELEAYRGKRDPASHAYKGPTKRNSVMFGEPGHAYLYFTYGFHWMLNIVTEKIGTPGAILIRAVEPVHGVESMKRNRGIDDISGLANGPGKLTQAFRIDGSLNGEDITTSQHLYILEGAESEPKIGTSTRIGITVGVNYRWRYFVEGNDFVSRARPSRPSLQNA